MIIKTDVNNFFPCHSKYLKRSYEIIVIFTKIKCREKSVQTVMRHFYTSA